MYLFKLVFSFFFFLRYILRSGITKSYGGYVFSFLRNFHMFSTVAAPIYILWAFFILSGSFKLLPSLEPPPLHRFAPDPRQPLLKAVGNPRAPSSGSEERALSKDPEPITCAHWPHLSWMDRHSRWLRYWPPQTSYINRKNLIWRSAKYLRTREAICTLWFLLQGRGQREEFGMIKTWTIQ